ncbi:MAG: TlpA family protein disulfide reductase, partial [Rhodospirillales bacterium]|nr:TlpA family protein disulfide reductase [Rhodospirillales bacterium]
MWQAVYDDHKDDDFMVIAVAQESRGLETAKEFIDLANPTYVVLIDQDHLVSDLYNLTNVPQAVWIDENGHIVRPAETAGSHDGWRAMNREDLSVPDDAAALV